MLILILTLLPPQLSYFPRSLFKLARKFLPNNSHIEQETISSHFPKVLMASFFPYKPTSHI